MQQPIITLEQLRRYLHIASEDTSEDSRLYAAILAASTAIERYAGRRFTPRHARLRHSVNLNALSELILLDDLLVLTALVNGDGQAIPLDDVIAIPDLGDSPAGVLRLVGASAFTYDRTPLHAISVEGIWGWHDRWTAAWVDTRDSVQDDPLTASATTLSVSSSIEADAEGLVPRFQVGGLLQIEEEYLRVIAVNSATHILTVVRGANGTIAQIHAQGTPIARYAPPPDVAQLCLRWAAALYREPDGSDKPVLLDVLASAAALFHRVRVGP